MAGECVGLLRGRAGVGVPRVEWWWCVEWKCACVCVCVCVCVCHSVSGVQGGRTPTGISGASVGEPVPNPLRRSPALDDLSSKLASRCCISSDSRTDHARSQVSCCLTPSGKSVVTRWGAQSALQIGQGRLAPLPAAGWETGAAALFWQGPAVAGACKHLDTTLHPAILWPAGSTELLLGQRVRRTNPASRDLRKDGVGWGGLVVARPLGQRDGEKGRQREREWLCMCE